MKIIFFGLGSIGRRHASIINRYYSDYKIYRYVRKNSNCLLDPIYYNYIFSWEEIDRIKPDIAFICNPTYIHIDTAIQCAKRNMHLFIEKPLCSNDYYLFNLIEIVSKNNLITYIAYPFRFHFNIKNNINEILLLSNGRLEIVCNTDISKWGKKSYSFNSKKGGGAIFELSHEIDLAKYLCGNINNFGCTNDFGVPFYLKTGKEIINRSIIKIFHDNDNGSISLLHLNLNSNKEERYISFKDTNGKKIKYEYSVNDQMYIDQINYFFDAVKKNNRFLMNNIYEASGTFQKILEMNRC